MHVFSYQRAWVTVALAALIAPAALAGGQSGITSKKVAISAASEINTADLSPFPRGFILDKRREPLNPKPPTNFRSGPSNSLRTTGSMLSTPRGSARSFFPSIDFTGYVPPDTDVAVGPTHVVTVVNTSIAFHRKSDGFKQFEQIMDGGGFFSGMGLPANAFVFDPKAFYDEQSGRFFVVILEVDEGASLSNALIAVSDDNNPNGTWRRYRVSVKQTSGGDNWWMDYPGWGYNKDAVGITGNMFPLGSTSSYGGTQITVMPKAPMLTGAAFTATQFRDPGGSTAQVAEIHDPTVDKIYAAGMATTTQMRIYAVSSPAGGAPTISQTNISVPAFIFPGDSIPSAGGRVLDGFDSRVFNLGYRNGRIYAAHNSQAGDGRFQVRWYEVNLNNYPSGTPTVRQTGNLAGPAGVHYHMPAINANMHNDISIVFTRSSSSVAADLMFAARVNSDSLGSMGAPVLLKSSGATYGFAGWNRWGDYFGLDVDPVDDSTFWGYGMIGNSAGDWITEVRSWVITAPGGNTSFINGDNINVHTGTYVSGDLASVGTSDNGRYIVQSSLLDKNGNLAGPGSALLGHVAAVESEFTLTPSGTMTKLSVKVEGLTTQTGASGQVFVWNWNTGKYEANGAFALSNTDRTTTVNITGTKLGNYMQGGTNKVRIMLRAVQPVKTGRNQTMPVGYDFGVDLFQVSPTFG